MKKQKTETELMREQVIDLELKARYWKAQHDIRFYTLEAEKLQPEYDEYVEKQRQQREELMKELQEEILRNQELQENGQEK